MLCEFSTTILYVADYAQQIWKISSVLLTNDVSSHMKVHGRSAQHFTMSHLMFGQSENREYFPVSFRAFDLKLYLILFWASLTLLRF